MPCQHRCHGLLATDLATMMGPLIGEPSPQLRRAMTTLEPGEEWLAGLAATDGRADWAIVLASDGSHIGEVVLNDYDEDNSSIGFRIALASLDSGRLGIAACGIGVDRTGAGAHNRLHPRAGSSGSRK